MDDGAAANDAVLAYGDITTLDGVDVRPAFAEAPEFLLARAAARAGRYRGPAGGHEGLITGVAGGFDPVDASRRALAELVEHASARAAARSTSLPVVAIADMERAGRQFIHPGASQRFDADPAAAELASLEDATTPIRWCPGRRLSNGSLVYVPAQAAFLGFQTPEEPLFARPDATGLAAHRTRAQALLHGLLECVERDACMLSWRVPGWPVRAIDAAVLSAPAARTLRALGLAARVFDVGAPGGVPVVLCLVAGAGGAGLTCGSSADESLEAAANEAVHEALALQCAARESAARRGSPSTRALLASRSGPHVQRWYDAQAARTDRAPGRPSPRGVVAVARWAEEWCGGLAAAADVTDPLARRCGWHVCRVVVEGMYARGSDGRAPHPRGGPRLRSTLERLGLTAGDVHAAPHPFG